MQNKKRVPCLACGAASFINLNWRFFSAIVETRLKFVEWGFWPLKGSGTKKTILIVIRFVVVDRPAKIKEFFLE
jgi:hypothetical protein